MTEDQRICLFCGASLPDNVEVCPNCALPLPKETVEPTGAIPESTYPSQSRTKYWLPYLAGGAGIMGLIIIGITCAVLVSWYLNRQRNPAITMQASGQPTAGDNGITSTPVYPANPTAFSTVTPQPDRTPTPTPESYYPLSNCAPSHLHVGDSAFVAFHGGHNAIRSSPDTHPSDNKIGNVEEGEVLTVVGGPECNYGWVLWEVRTKYGLQGWTPETDGNSFWLIPITMWQPCPGAPNSRLHIGDTAAIGFDPPVANRVRENPDTNSPKIGTINPGERVEIREGPQCAQNMVWWKVHSLETNLTGWTAEGDYSSYWLIPIIPRP